MNVYTEEREKKIGFVEEKVQCNIFSFLFLFLLEKGKRKIIPTENITVRKRSKHAVDYVTNFCCCCFFKSI